jgi:endonuclease/exonuclease/phosphatase family metal-dependent hydrolase
MKRLQPALLLVLLLATLGWQGCARYISAYFQNDIVDTAPQANRNTITVATFNAGILYGYIMGRKYFEPTPYSDKRLKLIPLYLRAFNIDVIGFQEVYRIQDKKYLIEALKDLYPYAQYYEKENDFGVGLHNGELFLSKLPIVESSFSLFNRNAISEKALADKGLLTIVVEFNGRKIALTNVHTTVGGGIYDTESDKANTIRSKQLLQALQATAILNADIRIILGDFNAGPNVSAVNHQLMLDHNYLDTYLENYDEESDCVTWNPMNKLNYNGYFPSSPPQRIDNIFIDKTDSLLFEVIESDVMLREEVLDAGAMRVPLSDHYGYFCKIKVK